MTENLLEEKAERLRTYMWSLTQRIARIRRKTCSLEDCNLSAQEQRAVEFLGVFGPSRMKDLADHVMLAVSSTTTLVDNLETKGLAVRERTAEDRRVVLVRLTDTGAYQFEQAALDYLEFCKNMLETLDDGDQDLLLDLFRKMSGS